jgi:hypothetical protein
MMRIASRALPLVLLLELIPATTFAQTFVCQTIRRGESAAQVARRVTGNSLATYQTWFQIMNASSRFIPKSQYGHIRAGWRACVIKATVADPPPTAKQADAREIFDARQVVEASAPAELSSTDAPVGMPGPPVTTAGTIERAIDEGRSLAATVLHAMDGVDLTLVWIGTAMALPWFGWRILDEHLTRRKTMALVVQHFATRFVNEFERPLIRDDAATRAVRSRLRVNVRRGRFDILLAPAQGRRYPNLADHRKNVEYDVTRVMQALAGTSFATGPLYTQAGWVVVPFQFRAGITQSGATCRSSL